MDGYLGKGHTLGLDNLYADPRLFEILIRKKTDAVGTFRTNRRGLPEGIASLKLPAGGHKIWYRVPRPDDNGKTISVLTWQDKKPVNIISTYHDDTATMVPDRAAGGNTTKKKFKSITDYRKVMCGVDKSDQIRSTYCIARRRLKRYYRKVFWVIVDKIIFNSWIIFNKLTQVTKTLRFLEFKKILFRQLVEYFHRDAVTSRNRIERPFPREDLRLDTTRPHLVVAFGLGSKNRQKYVACKFCYHQNYGKCRSQVDTYCKTCNVALCIKNKTWNNACFELYHTVEDYKNYRQPTENGRQLDATDDDYILQNDDVDSQ